MRISYLVGGLLLGLLVILALQYRSLLSGLWNPFAAEPPAIEPQLEITPTPQDPGPPPALTIARPPEAPPAAPQAPPPPPLNDSDSWVREALEPLSAPADWLAPDQLLRRAATVLAALAEGSVPRSQIAFLIPEAPYGAAAVNAGAAEGERLYRPDPSAYGRFEALLDVFLRLPPEAAATLFQRLEPRLDEAVRELGERRNARALMNAALAELAATPELETPPLLERPGLIYRYAAPELEGLSDLKKQYLRMGPDNRLRLRRYAEAFVAALNQAPLPDPVPSGLAPQGAESPDSTP